MGDEVEVKDETDDEWEPGTVQDVASGGDPLVRKEGYTSAFLWGHIRRSTKKEDSDDDGDDDDDDGDNDDVASSRSQSVARSVASSLAPSARTGDAYSVGDGVYVQDASGDDWQGSVQALDGNGEPGRVLIWARNNKKKAFKPRVKSEPREVLIHSRARNPTSPSKQRKRKEYLDARRQEVQIHARSRRPFSPVAAKRKQVLRTTPTSQQQQQSEVLKVRFAVGDLVDVKDATDEEWESGIVQGLDDEGAPKVRKEGFDSAFTWAHVRRSPVPGTRKRFVPVQAANGASAPSAKDSSSRPTGAVDTHESSGNDCPPIGSCGHGVLRVYAVDFALSQGLSASPGGATPTVCDLCRNGLAGAQGEHPTFYGCKKCRRAVCINCFLQQTSNADPTVDCEDGAIGSDDNSDDNDSSTITYVTSLLNDDSSTDDKSISSESSATSTSSCSEIPVDVPYAKSRPVSEASSEDGGDSSSPRVSDDNLRWAGTVLTPAQVKQAWRDSWRSPNGTHHAHGGLQQQRPLPRMNLDQKLSSTPPGSDATSSSDSQSTPGKLRSAAGRHSSGGSSSRKKRREFAGKEYAVLGGDLGSMDTINASDSGSGNSSNSGDDASNNEKGYRSVAPYSSEEDVEEEKEGPWGEFGSGCSCCCGCIRCCVGTCCSRAKPGGKSLVDAEGASGCCAPGTVSNARRIGRIMLWIFPLCYLLIVAYYVLYTDRIPKYMRRTYRPGRARWSTVAVVLPLCGFLAALVGNTVPLSGGLIFLPVLIAFNITGPLSTLPFCACMSVVSVGYLGFANNLVRGPDRFIWKAFPLVVIPAVTGHAIGVVRK